jgi:hypothetical protein
MLDKRDFSEAIRLACLTGAQDHCNACDDRKAQVDPSDLRGPDETAMLIDGFRDAFPDATDEQLEAIVDAWAHAWVGAHVASCLPCGCD